MKVNDNEKHAAAAARVAGEKLNKFHLHPFGAAAAATVAAALGFYFIHKKILFNG
jgi:hypothetical protein